MYPNPNNDSHQMQYWEESVVLERRVQHFGGKMISKLSGVSLVLFSFEWVCGVNT